MSGRARADVRGGGASRGSVGAPRPVAPERVARTRDRPPAAGCRRRCQASAGRHDRGGAWLVQWGVRRRADDPRAGGRSLPLDRDGGSRELRERPGARSVPPSAPRPAGGDRVGTASAGTGASVAEGAPEGRPGVRRMPLAPTPPLGVAGAWAADRTVGDCPLRGRRRRDASRRSADVHLDAADLPRRAARIGQLRPSIRRFRTTLRRGQHRSREVRPPAPRSTPGPTTARSVAPGQASAVAARSRGGHDCATHCPSLGGHADARGHRHRHSL